MFRAFQARARRLQLPLFTHVLLGLVLAASVAVGAGYGAWGLLDRPDMHASASKPADIVKFALTVTAGIGAVVALIVAYRRQRHLEAAEKRLDSAEAREDTKLFNERFRSAAEQLGSREAAIRLAGVYAMAGLADDWDAGRQTCINVLCAYIRMPYSPPRADPAPDASDEDREKHEARLQQREVRHAILSTIGERLRKEPASQTWHGHDFDFTGATIDGGDLSRARFIASTVVFTRAKFVTGVVGLTDGEFTGSNLYFHNVDFSGGRLNFIGSRFKDTMVSFSRASLDAGQVFFANTQLTDVRLHFEEAEFTGAGLYFDLASFDGGETEFTASKFRNGIVSFESVRFTAGRVKFPQATFDGAEVSFKFSRFDGGAVDFSSPAKWTTPPRFDVFGDGPPKGLRLPTD